MTSKIQEITNTHVGEYSFWKFAFGKFGDVEASESQTRELWEKVRVEKSRRRLINIWNFEYGINLFKKTYIGNHPQNHGILELWNFEVSNFEIWKLLNT